MPVLRTSASDVTTFRRVNATNQPVPDSNIRSAVYAAPLRNIIPAVARASVAAQGASPANCVLGTGGTKSCNYGDLTGLFQDNIEYISANTDDGGWYLSFGFPFYFNEVDYGSIGQVYFTTNHVIGFGDEMNVNYYDPPEGFPGPWNTDYEAILFGWYDRATNSFYSGPYLETRGSLQYHQVVFFGQDYYDTDVPAGAPNTVNYRIIFGRDEDAGYQYVEFQFNKIPTTYTGIWDLSYDGDLTGLFGSFTPQKCTTILLRSDLNGNNWSFLPGQTLGVSTTTAPPGGSLFFDRFFSPGPAPNSAWLTIPQIEGEFSPGSGDFSIEWWQNWHDDSYDNATPFIFNLGEAPNARRLAASWGVTIGGLRQFVVFVNGTSTNYGNPIPIDGVWIHVSVVRYNGVIYVCFNGKRVGEAAANTPINSSDSLVIGQDSVSPAAASTGYEGYITNFRYVVGSCAYGPSSQNTDGDDQGHLVPATPVVSIPNTVLMLSVRSSGTAYDDYAPTPHTVTNHGTTWDSSTPFSA